MKTVFKYLKPYYFKMCIGFIIKVSGTLAELVLPYILSHILEKVILKERIPDILFWGGLMILFAAIACICNIVANRMAAKVSRDFS